MYFVSSVVESRSGRSFLAKPFVYSKDWSLFLFERCSTSLMCAVKHRVQVGMLAFSVVHNASQHRGRSPYTLQSFFSYIIIIGTGKYFLKFFKRIFSICNDVSPIGVVDVIESAAESSLSGGDYSLSISAAIEQHHLHKSIFRLLRIIRKFLITT